MRSEVFLFVGCLMGGILVGCGEGPPPAPMRDAATRDRDSGADTRLDGGDGMDGGIDAGPDGAPPPGEDAGSPPDAGTDGGGVVFLDGSPPGFDGDLPDSGPLPDGGSCELPGGGRDYCACPAEVGCVTVDDCSTNQVCVSDPGCGVLRCDAMGNGCDDDLDCASGSSCARGGSVSMCVADSGECNDRRDCPSGHSCDAGTCVDRRVACTAVEDCPYGYSCNFTAAGAPYCVVLPTRCTTDAACLVGTRCRDVDGDGLSECAAFGACTTNADCGTDQACGTGPRLMASCSAYGPCTGAGDCASTHECVALAGDGVTHCVRSGGSCDSPEDCSPSSICAVPDPESPPRCIDAPL